MSRSTRTYALDQQADGVLPTPEERNMISAIRDPVEIARISADAPLPNRTYSACDRGGPVSARFLPVVTSERSFIAWALESYADAFSENDLQTLSRRASEDGWSTRSSGRRLLLFEGA